MAETHAPVSEEHRRAEQALLSKVIDAVRQFPLGHNHWDRTMQHGAGCELCIQQLEAKNKLMDLLRESPMNLLADALRDERMKALEDAATYIENESLPDTYSESCLEEFSKNIRALGKLKRGEA